jgi:hypothetical protein
MEFRLLWIGLLTCMADDQGRMLDNTALIKANVFPYDPEVSMEIIDAGLEFFASKYKLTRYVAGTNGSGRRLIQIINWWRYQKSTHWAARSTYPAPPKWVDRIRTHEAGSGQTPVKQNWDKEGGYVLSMKRLHSNYVAASKEQQSREEEEEEEEEVRGRRRDLPTPLPPSTKTRAEGGKAGQGVEPDLAKLNPKQKKAAEQIASIFRSSGLSGTKITSIIYQVAIRSSLRDPIAYTLAAFASAYADPKANKKPSIAAYRMQTDQVDPNYLKPDQWVGLPKDILKAAGIEDINSYVRQKQIESFTR